MLARLMLRSDYELRLLQVIHTHACMHYPRALEFHVAPQRIFIIEAVSTALGRAVIFFCQAIFSSMLLAFIKVEGVWAFGAEELYFVEDFYRIEG